MFSVRALPFASDGMPYAVLSPQHIVIDWFTTLRGAISLAGDLNESLKTQVRYAKEDNLYVSTVTNS